MRSYRLMGWFLIAVCILFGAGPGDTVFGQIAMVPCHGATCHGARHVPDTIL